MSLTMPESTKPYLVLARKYRPTTFADLRGQEALVQIISNAIKTNRIAHAFLLTGIRGIGKTTTARIIARALNCIGEDGKSGPTASPCGVCEHCTAISNDHHTDVIEMDAASRTGVNDIREIIENTQYLPSSARYKIYIIDEVHMLSNNAFNALLKTLEEPPAHVKFIFATTETRKIPITILSRCQRFDLKRLSIEALAEHLQTIATKEGYSVDADALTLLSSAAEGSVRDGLSLLDQAIAHTDNVEKNITNETVKTMLAVSDKQQVFTLFHALASGNINEATKQFHDLYQNGGDAAQLVQDLLEVTHILTQLKITPNKTQNSSLSEAQYNAASSLTNDLSFHYLTRAWQMLLKGLQEVHTAPNAKMAAEMLLIRLAYSANLPAPATLIKQIQNNEPQTEEKQPSPIANQNITNKPTIALQENAFVEKIIPKESPIKQENANTNNKENVNNFNELVELFNKKGEPILYHQLRDTNLVHFEQGALSLTHCNTLPKDFTKNIQRLLNQWTQQNWLVTLTAEAGKTTIKKEEEDKKEQEKQAIASHPVVKEVLDTFPGASVLNIETETT